MKFQRPLATALISLVICVSVVAQNTVFQARVIQVVDGTTVIVETQSKSQFHVRCLGAAAPREQESFGVESKQRLSAVLLDQTVTIEYRKRDENGNLLGSIRLNNQDVCLDQIRLGLAWLDADAVDKLSSSERRLYSTAESVARANTAGVWTPASTSTQSYLRTDETYVPLQRRTVSDGSFDNRSRVETVDTYTSTPGRKSWLRRNWWIFPTVGALVGGGYLVYRYSSGTGTGLGIPCVDGTISQAQHRQGACSHHGGIRP